MATERRQTSLKISLVGPASRNQALIPGPSLRRTSSRDDYFTSFLPSTSTRTQSCIRAELLELVEPSRKRRESELRELLDEFSVSHLQHSPAVALSGGERRRVEIARALATHPQFMLLDEPFAGIDPIAIGDIRQLVRQLTARGIGVLITDHNVRETLELIDRALIIHEGEVLTEGTPHEIVNNADVRRFFLGEDFSF